MEAMTVMGMAASQARFLGLTARKSNVEYQGQQINQQRTALSNESANLYNQMMDLTVPTPPSTSDFYKTSYVLENSSSSYASEDYTISSMTKTYNRENEYIVTLSSKQEYMDSKNTSYSLGAVTKKTEETDEGKTYNIYTIPLIDTGNKATTSIVYDESSTNAYTGENGSLSVNQYQIYKAEANKNLTGYDKCCTEKDTQYYFFQDSQGKNHFMTEEQLLDMVSNDPQIGKYNILYPYTYSKEVTTQVTATVEQSSTGRYSSIVIADDDSYPNDLKGMTFTLATVQEMDQNAYDDAYNDYEYEKAIYEKTISDINAQTEIVQQQDQQLELRLQQLDTEQNAIKTEMESVEQVIKDNVEKTFKVFA